MSKLENQILLELKNVNKSFGGVKAVRDLSFEVRSGDIQAIIGPNGAGKTTIFNLITGFYSPDSGEILFSDKKINDKPPNVITELGIARTFQNLELFPSLTVLENVMLGCYVRNKTSVIKASLKLSSVRSEEKKVKEKAREILEFVGLGKYADEPSGELPFGWQRLLEIARALATEPSLLLLDEPASGLNPRETDQLGELIEKLRSGGLTILLVEHDMSLTMDISDNILVMDYGKKIASGPPRQIQNDPVVLAAYLGEDISA